MNYQYSRSPLLALTFGILTLGGCSQQPNDVRTVGQLAVEHAGETLVGSGACAALEQLDGDCPTSLEWDNHGQYVSCVAKYLSARVQSGDLPEEAKDALVSEAARGGVGMKGRGRGQELGLGGATAGGTFGLATARDQVCP